MKCPFCKKDNDKVIDSRSCQNDLAIRRRRECIECGMRFTTYEHIEEVSLKAVKKSGERVPFRREQIQIGINKACEKRPVPAEKIEDVVNRIVEKITHQYEKEVPTRVVGELVMEELKELDQVAFVRFASVYREFKDVSEFIKEVKPMVKE